MKKVEKTLLILAVIFSIASFIALFLPYLIDLKQFKPKIQAMVAEKIDAKIDFSSARLSLFGGLGLKLKDVSLENTSKPFAGQKIFSAAKAEIQFAIIPLLAHKIIGTVYLNEPIVNIIKIGNQNNISSLSKPKTSNNKNIKSNEQKSYTLILDEFSATNANVNFTDLTKKSSPTVVNIKNINLDITREGNTLKIQNLNMQLFSGNLKSDMKVNLADKPPSYNGDCDLKTFSLEDVYKSFAGQNKISPIHGKANLDFTFNGNGFTQETYSKSLNANGTFKITEGAFEIDTTLPLIIDQLGRFLSTLSIPGLVLGITPNDLKKASANTNKSIDLQNMSGNFEIKKGSLFLNNDIPMIQGLLKMDVVIGLFTSRLLGTVTFIANDAFTKNLVATNPNFSYLFDKDGRFHLKIYLSGNVSNPNITVDTNDILRNVLQHTVKSIIIPIPGLDKVLNP